ESHGSRIWRSVVWIEFHFKPPGMAFGALPPNGGEPPPVRRSELRASADLNGVAGHPARRIGSEKADNIGDVIGMTDALQCLHTQSELAALLASGEFRHVG